MAPDYQCICGAKGRTLSRMYFSNTLVLLGCAACGRKWGIDLQTGEVTERGITPRKDVK